jgi:hypothetical protein
MSNYLSAGAGAASTVLSAQGYGQAGSAALYSGQAQQQQENYSADVLDQQAGQQIAQTSAQIADNARSTDLLESTIRARASASGGGATDPTVVNLESGVAGRGEYNSLSLLYSGKEKAAGMENQAALDRYMGTQSAMAGAITQQEMQTKAASSLLQGGSSLFSKFGGGGFSNPFSGLTGSGSQSGDFLYGGGGSASTFPLDGAVGGTAADAGGSSAADLFGAGMSAI